MTAKRTAREWWISVYASGTSIAHTTETHAKCVANGIGIEHVVEYSALEACRRELIDTYGEAYHKGLNDRQDEVDALTAQVEELRKVLKACQPLVEKHAFGFEGHALEEMVSRALSGQGGSGE